MSAWILNPFPALRTLYDVTDSFFPFVYVTSYDFLNKSQFCVHPSWGANAVIALDIFPAGVTSIRWRKRFTETGQTIIVTGQIHGCLCYLTHTHARTHPPPPHTHTMPPPPLLSLSPPLSPPSRSLCFLLLLFFWFCFVVVFIFLLLLSP